MWALKKLRKLMTSNFGTNIAALLSSETDQAKSVSMVTILLTIMTSHNIYPVLCYAQFLAII